MFEIENGAYILRAQPIHFGQLAVMKEMFRRCRNCLFIIGSANKANDDRNPLDIEMRLKMVTEALKEEGLAHDRVKVITLNDWSAEDDYLQSKTWGRFLYYNIANALNSKTFTVFYSDDKNIMLEWFRGTEIESYVDFCFINRELVKDGVSATKVRRAILDDDIGFLEKYCPKVTFMYRFEIKAILENLPVALPRN